MLQNSDFFEKTLLQNMYSVQKRHLCFDANYWIFNEFFLFSDDAILSKILKLGRAATLKKLFSLNQRWMAGERASLREAFFKVTWEFHGMIGRWMEVVLWYTRELAKCERAFPFNYSDVPFCFLVGILWKRWWQLSVHRMSGKMCSWK